VIDTGENRLVQVPSTAQVLFCCIYQKCINKFFPSSKFSGTDSVRCTVVLLWPVEFAGTELPVDPVSSWSCGVRHRLRTSVVSELFCKL
jgi:hypothetical protein